MNLAKTPIARSRERVAEDLGGRGASGSRGALRRWADLHRSVARALRVRFDVIDAAGAVAAQGLVGDDAIELPAGR